MIHTFFSSEDGRLLGCVQSADEATMLANAPQRSVTVTRKCPDRCYWYNGEVFELTEPPTKDSYFNYTTKQWVANPDRAWADVRKQRDRLLTASDWVVTKAAESGQVVPSMWVAYRQALRDVTLQTDPWNIVWPVTLV